MTANRVPIEELIAGHLDSAFPAKRAAGRIIRKLNEWPGIEGNINLMDDGELWEMFEWFSKIIKDEMKRG